MVCLGIPTLRPLYLRRRGMTEDHEDHPPNQINLEMPDFTIVEQHKQEQQQKQFGDHKLSTTSGSHSKADRSPSPPPPAYIRDSASSHTVVDIDSLRDVETFQTPLSPASMQKKSRRRRNDSVDDILGLYNAERSRSRGTAHSQATRSTMSAHESSSTTHITALKSLTSTTISSTECNAAKTEGAIMVKNEIWIGVERDEENWPLRS